MDLREVGSSGVDPGTHWYYKTKKIPLIAYFENLLKTNSQLDIFDIGAGSGFFSECLIAYGGKRVGDVCQVDNSFQSEGTRHDARIRGKLKRARGLPGEFFGNSSNGSLLLMMDVLEHVDDDVGFLRSIVERCRGRNYIFITVPAFMALWSSHDDFLGHRRRYELGALELAVSHAGIKVTSAYYLYGLIFPLVWLLRRCRPRSQEPHSDLQPAPKLVSLVLEWLCRCEFILRRQNRYFGLTCVLEGVIGDSKTCPKPSP